PFQLPHCSAPLEFGESAAMRAQAEGYSKERATLWREAGGGRWGPPACCAVPHPIPTTSLPPWPLPRPASSALSGSANAAGVPHWGRSFATHLLLSLPWLRTCRGNVCTAGVLPAQPGLCPLPLLHIFTSSASHSRQQRQTSASLI